MNREKNYLDPKNCEVKGKSCTSSASSNYTTCSDNPIENVNAKKIKLEDFELNDTLNSTILSGQILPAYRQEILSQESLNFKDPNVDINNETNCSDNVLNKNLDVILDNNDTFVDCRDFSQSDSYDESTKYLQIEPLAKLLEMKSKNHFYVNFSNLNKLKINDKKSNRVGSSVIQKKSQAEDDQLLTNLDGTEIKRASNRVTSDRLTKNKTLINLGNNTKDSGLGLIGESKYYDETSICNKNSTRRVLFENETNVQEYTKSDKLKNKKGEKYCDCHSNKNTSSAQKLKDINENCNTTESFISWEKFCRSSNNLISRRSCSFSELNSLNESYKEDDEISTSFKSLDDTYLSKYSFTINDINNDIKKQYRRYKSKSCDSLLREVRHLPHILYDRFLKYLAKEIENIRRQNIICTCQKELKKKLTNKENKKNLNYLKIPPIIQISNEKNAGITNFMSKNSPIKLISNQAKGSPKISKNLSHNIQRLSPKPVNKTPTTPSKKSGVYSWQKEIVSPVGEYIRGKRQSPFKTSPNKKKL